MEKKYYLSETESDEMEEYSCYREKEMSELEKYYWSDKEKHCCEEKDWRKKKHCCCEEEDCRKKKHCCCEEEDCRKKKHCCCEEKDCCKKKHCCEKKCCCEGKCRDKKHDQKHGKDNANLADFEFFTLNPNVSEPNRFELPVDQQQAVASVTLDKVKQGDLVWLNGVFGLDNDDFNDVATIIMRVFKANSPMFVPGQEIYRAVIEIDDEGNDDQVVEPLAHVDVITKDEKNVTYTVTLETNEDPVFLNGPVTFTAALIRKDKDKE